MHPYLNAYCDPGTRMYLGAAARPQPVRVNLSARATGRSVEQRRHAPRSHVTTTAEGDIPGVSSGYPPLLEVSPGQLEWPSPKPIGVCSWFFSLTNPMLRGAWQRTRCAPGPSPIIVPYDRSQFSFHFNSLLVPKRDHGDITFHLYCDGPTASMGGAHL